VPQRNVPRSPRRSRCYGHQTKRSQSEGNPAKEG
jgi:hypothetical protein